MKLLCTLALFATLSVTVNGWLVSLVQPIILSFGAAFAALNVDLEPIVHTIEWKKLMPFITKQDSTEGKPEDFDGDAAFAEEYCKEYTEEMAGD